eukprot:TRINITY_DN76991_c0_g1_i1.p1 TRINITY_DN76991_c0_g1~~TRINITY_DN76991_c0_g1_i1.p1  ORF type:complete len:381 (-),score=83.10 TRINITY_DN76991_c0_g1_i1:172-1314(-)
MRIPSDVQGMLFMAAASGGVSMMLILSKVAKNIHMPFYSLMGFACLLQTVLLLAVAMIQCSFKQLDTKHYKWVWFRGLFGCATYILYLLAIACGAPLGDVSALTSVNVVVAAFLGRAFLGEPLRWLHVSAVGLSLAGALLISKPSAMFEGTSDSSDFDTGKLVGYALALGSGVASGGVFIAARKVQGISVSILTSSVSFQEGIALLALSYSKTIDEPSLEQSFAKNQLAVIGMLLALLSLSLVGSMCMSVGAQLCPAAASSTIWTSVGMSLGYLAQYLMTQRPPELLSLVGAGLMLLAVMVIAFTRLQSSVSDPPTEMTSQSPAASTNTNEAVDPIEDDDAESLSSFIASEFSGISSPKPRHRRVASTLPVMQIVGATAV